MSDGVLAALAAPAGFIPDPRFAADDEAPRRPAGEDAAALARAAGHAAGRAEAAAQAAEDDRARERIELALAQYDAALGETLRHKLLLTVQALCEAAIAPLALDHEALAARVERAAALLVRPGDERVLHLHPGDLALIAGRLPAGLDVRPDRALERGALRIETTAGGVEDGPEHWRRAIAEALARC